MNPESVSSAVVILRDLFQKKVTKLANDNMANITQPETFRGKVLERGNSSTEKHLRALFSVPSNDGQSLPGGEISWQAVYLVHGFLSDLIVNKDRAASETYVKIN